MFSYMLINKIMKTMHNLQFYIIDLIVDHYVEIWYFPSLKLNVGNRKENLNLTIPQKLLPHRKIPSSSLKAKLF